MVLYCRLAADHDTRVLAGLQNCFGVGVHEALMHEGVNRGHRVGRKSEALWGRDLSEGHPRHIVSPFRYCYHTARGLVDNSFLFGIEFDVVLQFPSTYHVERGV